MLLKFELSMPNKGSWNGKWTGESDLYAKVIKFAGKEKIKLANELIKLDSFYYNFGDGWSARVSVEKIDSKEATKVRKKSRGFYGCDWMITSIIKNKEIVVDKTL